MAAATGNKREVVQFTSYSRKLRDNIKSITDNYGEILKAAKVQNTIISISKPPLMIFLIQAF